MLGPSGYPRTTDNTLSIIPVGAPTLRSVGGELGEGGRRLDTAIQALDDVGSGRRPKFVYFRARGTPESGLVVAAVDDVVRRPVNNPAVGGDERRVGVGVGSECRVDVDLVESVVWDRLVAPNHTRPLNMLTGLVRVESVLGVGTLTRPRFGVDEIRAVTVLADRDEQSASAGRSPVVGK